MGIRSGSRGLTSIYMVKGVSERSKRVIRLELTDNVDVNACSRRGVVGVVVCKSTLFVWLISDTSALN